MKKTIYVLTAVGVAIDTLVEVFPYYEDAMYFMCKHMEKYGILFSDCEKMCENCWKGESMICEIEWQIHRKEITV